MAKASALLSTCDYSKGVPNWICQRIGLGAGRLIETWDWVWRGDPQKGLTAPFLCENNVTALRNLALEFAKFLVFFQKTYAWFRHFGRRGWKSAAVGIMQSLHSGKVANVWSGDNEGGTIRKEAGIWLPLYHLLHLVALGKYSNICESLFPHPDCGKSDYDLNGLLRDDVWKPTRAVLGT